VCNDVSQRVVFDEDCGGRSLKLCFENLPRNPMRLNLALVLLSLLCMYLCAGLLPARVAVHFSFSGIPDGWSSRTEFLVLFAALILFLPALMLGIAWAIKVLPTSMINMPNSDYWLLPERKEEAFRRIQSVLHAIAATTTSLLLFMFIATVHANRQEEVRLASWSWLGMAVYCVAMALIVARMYRVFRLPPQT